MLKQYDSYYLFDKEEIDKRTEDPILLEYTHKVNKREAGFLDLTMLTIDKQSIEMFIIKLDSYMDEHLKVKEALLKGKHTELPDAFFIYLKVEGNNTKYMYDTSRMIFKKRIVSDENAIVYKEFVSLDYIVGYDIENLVVEVYKKHNDVYLEDMVDILYTKTLEMFKRSVEIREDEEINYILYGTKER